MKIVNFHWRIHIRIGQVNHKVRSSGLTIVQLQLRQYKKIKSKVQACQANLKTIRNSCYYSKRKA